MNKVVHVAVGVIVKDQRYFLTKRHAEVHQGGKWEFPGGKVEWDETVSQALSRELMEEIGIQVLSCQPLTQINHDYGDKEVCLEVFIVDNFIGEPKAQEGQQESWFTLEELLKLDFPAANIEIVTLLKSD